MQTRIREVRRASGLTLAEVAARCHPTTTAQTIGRLETGMRTVSMGWLARIADALGVTPSDLLTLPYRTDIPVTAVLGHGGASSPHQPATLTAPAPQPGDVAVTVEVSQGDHRAGDQLWLRRLDPPSFAEALNRDVLVPRPVGRFAFGRLLAVEGTRLNLLPSQPGARQIVVADAPWIGVVRTLVRLY